MGTLAKYDKNFNQKWSFNPVQTIAGIDWWGDGEKYIISMNTEEGSQVIHAEIDWAAGALRNVRVLDTIGGGVLAEHAGCAFSQIGFGEQQVRAYDYIMFVRHDLTFPLTSSVKREDHKGRRLRDVLSFFDVAQNANGVDINDRNGDFYLSLSGDDTGLIRLYDVDGRLKRQLTAPTANPGDICFDGQSIWVADQTVGQTIIKIDQQGNIRRQSGSLGFTPKGVCTDGQDLIVCS